MSEAGAFPLIKFEGAQTSLWLFCRCLKGFVSREQMGLQNVFAKQNIVIAKVKSFCPRSVKKCVGLVFSPVFIPFFFFFSFVPPGMMIYLYEVIF